MNYVLKIIEEMNCNTKPTNIIDIVLPCYNPPAEWEKRVVENYIKLHELFNNYKFNFFIVTDGSTKGYSKEIIDYLNANVDSLKIIDYKNNMGKGYALRTAVKECNSNFILYIDHDFPYTWESIKNVFCALENGADVVVAVRDESYQKALPRVRKILSYSSHLLNKIVLRLKITDTQGGMKGFNKKGREIFLATTINSFLFDTQFIYKATHKRGTNVVAIQARIKEGLKMSVMGIKVLRREFFNIFVILSNR
ncbi:MAG: glycosyltransferase [Bacteroidales bacterium]